MIRKIYTTTIWTQVVYTILTALWAIIDIESFMQVTGPKTDVWLVKTVAVLLLPIALGLLSGIFRTIPAVGIIKLAISYSMGLAIIFITRQTIP